MNRIVMVPDLVTVNLNLAYSAGSLADPALRFGPGSVPGLREIGPGFFEFQILAGDLKGNGGVGSGAGPGDGLARASNEWRLSVFGGLR